MTEEDVIAELRCAIERCRSQKEFAKEACVSQQYVTDVLRGRRAIGPTMLLALGFRKIVTYERICDGKQKET